jgi:DNA-binding SARP family transcriptional activator
MGEAVSAPFSEVRLLGPVELGRQDGTSAAIGIRHERTLLAVLAVNAGLVVSADVLVDALWGSSPPRTARHALQVHASSLRRRLGSWPSPLEARSSGYVLRLGPGQLDTERFESLAAAGRAELASDQAVRAVNLLEAALSVWRGPALADVSMDRAAETEVARLEESRRTTEEDRVDAELAAGHSEHAAGMAEAMAAAEPFRERRWAQLMLALYRCGRQAEALRAFIDVRDLLRDELGVDPGPALQDLQRKVLAQDPALDVVSRSTSPARPSGGTPVTRFTSVGSCAIAYQVVGDGPTDLVFIPGFTGHLTPVTHSEALPTEPPAVRSWRAAPSGSVSAADTAACGCPLQEPVGGAASAAGVQPPPPGPADLAVQPPAQLLAHPGHSRPLQRQGLLGGQPAELQPFDLPAAPAGEDRTGGRVSGRGGRSGAHTARCRLAAAQPDAAATPGRLPAHQHPRRRRQGQGAGRGSSPAPGRSPGTRRVRCGRTAPLAPPLGWWADGAPGYPAGPPPS